MNSIKISIVTPIYNAEDCIEELYNRIINSVKEITSDYEIIMVNDASLDNSWGLIKKLIEKDKSVKGINLARNFGQHPAIVAGLTHAKGDWIVVMDCDLQDNPNEIPTLYNHAIKNDYDIAFAARMERQDTFIKATTSYLFYKFLSYMTSYYFDPEIANFSIAKRKVIDAYISLTEKTLFFPIHIHWLGFNIGKVPVQHNKRFAGKTSYTFKKLLSLAFDIIIAMSNKPLKVTITSGFIIAMLSFCYLIYLVFMYLFLNIHIVGWTSLAVVITFSLGILLFFMGIHGLYLDRIYRETKNRPTFVIKEIESR
jgi:dolichol-phosphate mannosyltransferase